MKKVAVIIILTLTFVFITTIVAFAGGTNSNTNSDDKYISEGYKLIQEEKREGPTSVLTTNESGSTKRDDVTDKNGAIKGNYQSDSDSYTSRTVNREDGATKINERTTNVTGGSSYGNVDVKAGNGTADVSLGNYGNSKGYSDSYSSKTTKKLTPTEIEELWYKENVNTKLEKEIDQAMKDLSESDYIVRVDIYKSAEESGLDSVEVTRKSQGEQITRYVKDYYVNWEFYNKTTGKKWSYQKYTAPMDNLDWKFSEVGSYRVVSTPWSQWDVGHWDYYTVIVTDADGNKHVVTKSTWVHEYYVDGWYSARRRTYDLTISVDDLNKIVRFPITEEKKVVPIDELVK